VGTLNYMSPEAILGGTNNIRGGAPMKVLPEHTLMRAGLLHCPINPRCCRDSGHSGVPQTLRSTSSSGTVSHPAHALQVTRAGGASVRHLELGLHPVPDGVWAHAIQRAGLHPEGALHLGNTYLSILHPSWVSIVPRRQL